MAVTHAIPRAATISLGLVVVIVTVNKPTTDKEIESVSAIYFPSRNNGRLKFNELGSYTLQGLHFRKFRGQVDRHFV